MTVLVLRPETKIAETCRMMESAGINCVGVGLIKTQAIDNAIAGAIDQLNSQDNSGLAIFISTTAVQMLFSTLKVWPKNIQAIAIGKGTAKILAEQGVDAIVPEVETTEGLLELAELQDIEQHPVFLFKGKGGRSLLPESLEKRGARLTSVDLYHRINVSELIFTKQFSQSEIDTVVATSGEIMAAAFDYFEAEWLKSLTWIVVSRRLVEFAAKLEIKDVLQSDGAATDKLIEAINQVGVINDG